MNNIIKSLGTIFITLFFPLFIATVIYDTERFDEINKKKVIQFEKILVILDKSKYLLKERLYSIGDVTKKRKIYSSIKNNLNKLEKEYVLLKIYSNNEYDEIDSIIKNISETLIIEIFNDNIKGNYSNERKEEIYYQKLNEVSEDIKRLEDKFYDEYNKSINENPLIRTFNRIINYPKNLNFKH